MTEQPETISQTPTQAFDLTTAIEHGKKQVISTEYKGIPVFIIPSDMKLHALENLVEQQLPHPYKLKESVELLTEQSFVDYFNRYATESSTIFVDDKEGQLVAVLDYHDKPDQPAWKNHRATYKCPQTKEWGSWTKNNNNKMTQEEFALFIEENVREIFEPNGAEMMQIAATLKAKNNVDFRSSTRLDNGEVQFMYTETIQGQAGVNGQLSIPEKFTLALSPFLKGTAYEIEARLRYRINPGGLQMWYTLIRPHTFADHAFTEIVTRINDQITKGHLVHGRI